MSESPDHFCAHCGLPVPWPRRKPDEAETFCCFGCRFAHEIARPSSEEGGSAGSGTLLLRVGVGIFVTLNIMVFNWLLYWQHVFGTETATGLSGTYESVAALASYGLMLLCTIVIVTLGIPLAGDAIATSRRLRPDVNLLIVIAVLAAFALSVANTLRGDHHVYYDTVALILVFVTVGRYLDAQTARRAALETSSLLDGLPNRVTVRRDGSEVEVDTTRLRAGDVVAVAAGQAVPVDGRILEGRGHLDEARLTGESRPRSADVGDAVMAGSVSMDGHLWVRADAVAGSTLIARMQEMLETARQRQPRIQRVADRVAAWFIPGVTLLAVTVFLFHLVAGNATRGVLDGLSVLLISCPCALGFAVPLTTWAALGRAAAHGILIDSGRTLERAAAIRHVIFDKTGTLTHHDMRLEAIDRLSEDADEAEALRIAASISGTVRHPVAQSLRAAARSMGLRTEAPVDASALPGLGVEASLGGRTYRLGSHRIAWSDFETGACDDGLVHAYLFDSNGPVVRFRLGERLRDAAPRAITLLRDQGLSVEVLTGDRAGPAERIARRLGVPVTAELLPGAKVDGLRRARTKSGQVAVVGDGINDAAVLAESDVGFAMGSGTDLAHQAGHVRLVGDALEQVPLTLAIARHAKRRIRINLAWAFGYNGIGIGLAAMGLLSPVLAALAMVGSSLLIVMTARGAGAVVLPDDPRVASSAAAGSTPAPTTAPVVEGGLA